METFELLNLGLKYYLSSTFTNIIFIFLAFYLCYIFIKVLLMLWNKFLIRGKDLIQTYGHGSYALINSANNDLGKAFAFDFARRGFSLILVDKVSEELTELSHSIMARYPNVEVRKIVFDFKNCQKDGHFDELFNYFAELDISILVNNTEMHCSQNFINIEEKELLKLINKNLIHTIMMTKRILPKLIKRPRRSGIITISSNTVLNLYPSTNTTDKATKTYLNYFIDSLNKGLRDKIDFLTITPGFLSKFNTPPSSIQILEVSPEKCIESSLKHLGKSYHCYGHWRHEFLSLFIDKIPFGTFLMKNKILREYKTSEDKVKEN